MDATSRNPSVDAANTPSSSKETRRSRRKRDKTDTVDTADATQSSSSTPKPSTEHRSKEEKSSTKRNGRSRKSRENSVNGHSEGQPLTNGHTFEEGEDFIALGVDSDEEQGGGSRWKGKGRETNTADDHGEGRGGYSDRREEPSNGDRKDNGKDGAQDSKSRWLSVAASSITHGRSKAESEHQKGSGTRENGQNVLAIEVKDPAAENVNIIWYSMPTTTTPPAEGNLPSEKLLG